MNHDCKLRFLYEESQDYYCSFRQTMLPQCRYTHEVVASQLANEVKRALQSQWQDAPALTTEALTDHLEASSTHAA
ncbi:hypothetical protein [Pseudanabaena sp. FACHB-2040]|uniref:hypothetical protein n=1 Tax=Pseudanabaena sp. FACHB-2040 TaxID=2692859 RepID=UPI001685215A|nr:hypothetical protein [Pseudanabaena sp. FACHB-2040]MBD2256069.1 hypothetical protein [Pseudanabaena sp. FACHB-2040]